MQSRQAQLVRASELYYERGLSQQKIADILGVSRPTVSRLLEEARKSGVVEIVVHAPLKQNYELSERLRRELGLKDAVVIQGEASPDRSPALRRCAQAAGQLFLSLLESGMTVGLSWGRVLRQFCDTLPQQKHTFNVNVVQTIGCLGTGNPHLDGLELTLALAKKLNGTFYNVYAPVYVDSALVQSYLLREPSVELAIRQAGQADIILTGIGSLTDNEGSLCRAGYFTPEERRSLVEAGAAAVIQGRLLDRNGRELAIPGRYVVGASLEELHQVPWRIGINAGQDRAVETLASVRSGCVNLLVVDEPLALEVLKLNNSIVR